MILITALVLLLYPLGVPAPVPRCSPFIIINKLSEFTNLVSDANPYFPVKPCEYGNPLNAIAKQDFKAVTSLADPFVVPKHLFYESLWFFKTGLPRMLRVANGKEKLIMDNNILNEGFQHYTKTPRTLSLGHGTKPRPEIIDDFGIYRRVVGGKMTELFRNGPDKRPTVYTPQGILRRSEPDRRSAYQGSSSYGAQYYPNSGR